MNQCEEKIHYDEIDLIELFKKIYSYKKIIIAITILFAMFSFIYLITSTPLYKAKALIEAGYYKNGNNEVILENIDNVIKKSIVTYIESVENIPDLDYKVEKIETLKDNKKFFNIEVLAKSNDIAKNQINKIVNQISIEHKNILDEYIEKQKVKISNLDRRINFLQNNQIKSIEQQIEYIKNFQIPSIDKKIHYIQNTSIPAAKRDLESIDNIILVEIDKNINLNRKKLEKYEAQLQTLPSMRKSAKVETIVLEQMIEQNLYTQISNSEQQIISLESRKEALISQTKPSLQDKIDRLTSIDIGNLETEKDVILTNKIPALERELANLKVGELEKLLDEKSILELSLKPYNYQNTQIVSDIITSDKPAKPKKILILGVAVIAGFLLSIFFVLIYDAIKNHKTKLNN